MNFCFEYVLVNDISSLYLYTLVTSETATFDRMYILKLL